VRDSSKNKKGTPAMKSLMPWKTKKTQMTGVERQQFPFVDFAFSLSRMRDDFDRFFDRLASNFSAMIETNGEGWRWDVDVADKDDTVVVRAEAPGFDVDDFDVRVEDNQLVMRASKKVEKKDDKGNVQECREQECFESIALPPGIDKDKVEAEYRNGILTVTIPKSEEVKPKRIVVKSD
jgi:HSP20 family protein